MQTIDSVKDLPQVLNNVELKVKEGELVGICGSVGSGKTSLIAALLGDMRLITTDGQEGQLVTKVVNIDGKIAYCQ